MVRESAGALDSILDDGETKEASVGRKTPEDSHVFARIVHEHKRAVFAVAYAKLRNMHDAEDVMQEVFIAAYQSLKKLRKPDSIGAWLHRATLYRCKDHIRKKVRRKKREHIFAEAVANNPTSSTQADIEQRDALLEAIGRLPEKYRLVLMLKHFAQLSYADISSLTGLSNTAISNHLQLARKRLKATLIKMGEGVD